MGKTMKALEVMVKDLDSDLTNWAGTVRKHSESFDKMGVYLKEGIEMLYHQATDLQKKHKMTDPKIKLKQLDHDKSLAAGVKELKTTVQRYSKEVAAFWKQGPPMGDNLIKRCAAVQKTLDDVLKHKTLKGTKSKSIDELGALKKKVAKVGGTVDEIMTDFKQLFPRSSDQIFKDISKLSTDTTVKDLGGMSKTAVDDVKKQIPAYNKNYSRLHQVKQAKLDAAAKLVKKIAADFDKQYPKGVAP